MQAPCPDSSFILPPSSFEGVPCGNRTGLAGRTCLSRLEGWHLCRSAKGTCCFFEAEAVGLEPTTG
jgi:hypothetical protein